MEDRIQLILTEESRNIMTVAAELSMLCVLKQEEMIDDAEYELLKKEIIKDSIKASSIWKGTDNG